MRFVVIVLFALACKTSSEKKPAQGSAEPTAATRANPTPALPSQAEPAPPRREAWPDRPASVTNEALAKLQGAIAKANDAAAKLTAAGTDCAKAAELVGEVWTAQRGVADVSAEIGPTLDQAGKDWLGMYPLQTNKSLTAINEASKLCMDDPEFADALVTAMKR
jgi:hypothetical protein